MPSNAIIHLGRESAVETKEERGEIIVENYFENEKGGGKTEKLKTPGT
jgi:hypothetical protein